jgi:hypothetical protein
MEQINASEAAPGTATGQLHPVPQGIGTAVAFDWAFAVQLLIIPYVPLLLGSLGLIKPMGFQPAAAIITLVAAIVFAALGEGVRRGVRWTRIVQITWNTLGFLGGIGALFVGVQASRQGNYGILVPALVLLIFSPIIVWRMSRPATGQWFRTVTSAEARRRHGGSWPWLILLWSVAGGVLVELASTLLMH